MTQPIRLLCDKKLELWLGASELPARTLDQYQFAKLCQTGGFIVVLANNGDPLLWRIDPDARRSK
jgi:hypothetical protein